MQTMRSGPPLNPQHPAFWEFLDRQTDGSRTPRDEKRLARLRRMAAHPSAVRAFPARHALASHYVERVGRDDAAAGGGRDSRAWRLLHMLMLDVAPHRLRRDLQQWQTWWNRPASFAGPFTPEGGDAGSWGDVLRHVRAADPASLTRWLESLVAPLRTTEGGFPPWEPYVSGVRRHGVLGAPWWPEASSDRAGGLQWRRPATAGSAPARDQVAFRFAPILVLGFAPALSPELLSLCADIVGAQALFGMLRARVQPEEVALDARWTAQAAPSAFWRAILDHHADELPGRWIGGDGTWQYLGERDVWLHMAREWMHAQLVSLQHPTARPSARLDLRVIGAWLLQRTAYWAGRRAIGPDLWLLLLQVARETDGAMQSRVDGLAAGATAVGEAAAHLADLSCTPLDWLVAETVRRFDTHWKPQIRQDALFGGSWMRLVNDVSIQACLRRHPDLAQTVLRSMDLRRGVSEPLVLTILEFGQPGHWTRQQWQLVRRMCLTLLSAGDNSIVSVDPTHFHEVCPFFGAACRAIAALPSGDEVRSLLFRVVLQQVLHLSEGGSRGRLLSRAAQATGQTAVLEELWGAWLAGEPTGASGAATPSPLTVCVPRLVPLGAGRPSFSYLIERPWSPTLSRFLLVAPIDWLRSCPRTTWKQGVMSQEPTIRQRWIGRLAALVLPGGAREELLPTRLDGGAPQGRLEQGASFADHGDGTHD